MKEEERFSLEPFSTDGPVVPLKITGRIVRKGNTIHFACAFSGRLGQLVMPAPADLPLRRDSLWKGTCFELFLAVRGFPRYWEFNMSPAGHWNVYNFSGYREGMREESEFAALPFSIERGPDCLALSLEASLDGIIAPGQIIDCAVSAVTVDLRGKTFFWALAHPGPKPDFHNREGFLIGMAGRI